MRILSCQKNKKYNPFSNRKFTRICSIQSTKTRLNTLTTIFNVGLPATRAIFIWISTRTKGSFSIQFVMWYLRSPYSRASTSRTMPAYARILLTNSRKTLARTCFLSVKKMPIISSHLQIQFFLNGKLKTL